MTTLNNKKNVIMALGRVNMTLRLKIIVPTIILVTLIGVGIFLISTNVMTKSLTHEIRGQLISTSNLAYTICDEFYPGDWKVRNNTLYKGKEPMLNNSEFVSFIKRQTGCEVTIFHNSTRVATSVIDETGRRAIGTNSSIEVTERVIKQGQEFIGEANVLGKPHEARYVPIKDKNGNILGMFFMGVPKEQALVQTNKLKKQIGIMVLIILLITLAFTYRITYVITGSINKILKSLKAISTGDLTTKCKVKSNDEIGLVADELTDTITHFNQLVYRNKQAQESISREIAEITATIKNVSIASQQVEQAAQEVSKGSQNQAEEIEGSLISMSDLAENLIGTKHSTRNIIDANEEMHKKTEEGSVILQSLTDEIKNNTKINKLLIDGFKDLIEKSHKIAGITDIIKEISGQTKLLALNANIEAARAGEAGRGFAVVAQEVGKLSVQTDEATKSIHEMVNEIKEALEMGAKSINRISTITENVEQTLIKTSESFTEIKNSSNLVFENIKELATQSAQVEQIKDLTLESMQNISAVAEETAAMAEEANASAEMTNEAIAKVEKALEKTEQSLEQLIKAGNVFRINQGE